MTPDERRLMLRADHIRRQFQSHSDAVREIIQQLRDEQLIEMSEKHHAQTCRDLAEGHLRGSRVEIPAHKVQDKPKRRGWFRR